ncbi:IS5 family transposase [Sinimarinibacterium thermocellulolyticum]|uniref:IS5 family transposase n=1 Tax=Sinimarinibacterium thermocellulolyticum TaxID=3170016 RepID=A0ABV2AE03_9GAMM
MRGIEIQQGAMFSYVSLEQRVPKKHPLRTIRALADAALQEMDGALTVMYSHTGRPSIPPERLIRALLLQMFFSVRSERLLMEQLDYNLLFRWFVGLGVDDEVWDASTFAKNRDRLVDHDVGRSLLAAVVAQAKKRNLISDEHFSVDGTLIEAWASMKSFRRKDDNTPPPPSGGSNVEVDFRGETRSNATHESKTDPECRLYRKGPGQESKLAYLGHALMENRNGLAVDGCVTQADGYGERNAAMAMIDAIKTEGEITLGADKGYDASEFVERLHKAKVVPHIAQNTKNRRSAVPAVVAKTDGYAVSQILRKRIEEIFGWAKEVGGMARVKLRGLGKVDWRFTMTLAAYNLMRLHKLVVTPPATAEVSLRCGT